ncbi:zeta toxin family protein [Streptomyces sp. NPDC002324]
MDPKRYSLPGKEHDRIYRDVVRPLVLNIPAAEQPTAVILCGTPGMGKSSVARQILANEPAAKISSDKLSKFHPQWSHLLAADDSTAGFYARHDAVKWVDAALHDATTARLPILVDTALASPDRARDLSRLFRDANYPVHVVAVTGPGAFSQLGVLHRHYTDRQAQGGARFVDSPDSLFPGVAASVRAVETESLADSITVYRRTGEVLFRNTLDARGRMELPAGAEAAVRAERTRKWTEPEARWFADTAERLAGVPRGELGPGTRDRWSSLVAEAVSSAQPFMHPAHSHRTAQLLRRLPDPEVATSARVAALGFPGAAADVTRYQQDVNDRDESGHQGPARGPAPDPKRTGPEL